MFCPQCRSEYLPGPVQCADCGVLLVDSLDTVETPVAGAAPQEWGELVTVFESADLHEITVVQSLLQGAGIPSLVTGDGVQGMFAAGLWAGAAGSTGPVQLQVPEAQAEEAREIVAAPPMDPEEWDENE